MSMRRIDPSRDLTINHFVTAYEMRHLCPAEAVVEAINTVQRRHLNYDLDKVREQAMGKGIMLTIEMSLSAPKLPERGGA